MCAGSIKMQNKGHTLPDGLMPRPRSRFRVFPCAWLKVGLLALLLNAAAVSAGPVFDTSTPLSFFTNVASRLLSAQMNVNLGQLEIYNQVAYGISDQAYEAIPSQLLPLLRVDSTGQMISTNGQIQVQFSGYDGHEYAIQVSPDLLNWSSVSTNAPANGVFSAALPTPANSPAQFYRSLLIQ